MNVLSPSKVVKLRHLYRRGFSVRLTARMVGCSTVTVGTYFDRFSEVDGDCPDPYCPCGKPKHYGWCHWRFMNSSKRQMFTRQRGWYKKDIYNGVYDGAGEVPF